MLKSFQNYIVFKTDKMFEDKVKLGGKDGRELIFDPMFQPWLHVRTFGEVVDIPIHLGPQPMPMQEYVGTPEYFGYAPTKFKKLSDIEPEVEIGDKIYFHFNTVALKNMMLEEGEHPNKTYYFKVRYDQVICAVRESMTIGVIPDTFKADGGRTVKTTHKRIIPIGSYTLVEPDYETWDDILIPTYTDLVDEQGKKIPKPKDKWIQTKVMPKYHELKGYVRHVGTPLKGDECQVNEGDHIIYRKNADWTVKIEGKDYFVIRQRHILGVLEKV